MSGQAPLGGGPPLKTLHVVNPAKLGGLTLPEILSLQACPPGTKFVLRYKETVEAHCSEKGPYYRDPVPIGTFLTFWVPVGSLFKFQGPYFQCFGLINAKNVNSVYMYCLQSFAHEHGLHIYKHCFCDLMHIQSVSELLGLLDMLIYALLSSKYPELHLCALLGPYWVPVSQKK